MAKKKVVRQDQPEEPPYAVGGQPPSYAVAPAVASKPPKPTATQPRTIRATRRRLSVRTNIPSRGYNYTDASYTGATPQMRAREVDQAQMAAQVTRANRVWKPAIDDPTPIPVGAPRRNEYYPPQLVKSNKITGESSAKVRQRGGRGAPMNVAPPKRKK